MPKFSYILQSSNRSKPAFCLGCSRDFIPETELLVALDRSILKRKNRIKKAIREKRYRKENGDVPRIAHFETFESPSRLYEGKLDYSGEGCQPPTLVGSDEDFSSRPRRSLYSGGILYRKGNRRVEEDESFNVECIEYRFDHYQTGDAIAIWSDDLFELMDNLQVIRSYLTGTATPQLDLYVQQAEDACSRTVQYMTAICNELIACSCGLPSFIANYKYIINKAIEEFKKNGFDDSFNKEMLADNRKLKYFKIYVDLCIKVSDGFRDMIEMSDEELANRIFEWDYSSHQDKLSRCNIVKYLESLVENLEPSQPIEASLKLKLKEDQVRALYEVLVSYKLIDSNLTSFKDMYYFCTGQSSARIPMNKVVWQSSVVDLVYILREGLECRSWKVVSEIFMYYEGNSILPTKTTSLKTTSSRLNDGNAVPERTRQIANKIIERLSA